jgi:deoxyribose-phosphate aldolase
MSLNNENIEQLVELITKKVTERLSQSGTIKFLEEPACLTDPNACNNCGQCVINKPGAVNNIVDTGATRLGSSSGIVSGVDQKVAAMIDHTLLKPDATKEELTKLCQEARDYNFATCCVNSSNIPFAARLLRGSSVKPIAVVGFPLGAASTQAKVFESREAIRNGAEEIDMVINIGAIKDRDYQLVYEDILKVVEASKPKKVKVIIETSSLSDEEKIIACALSKAANAAFVKTSTGFAGGGATVQDIELMRKVVGNDMEVKASGGVRTKEDADAMIKAGANRIGASASVAIVTGKNPGKGKY